ncbi:MAG: DUF4339 domain-containing protein [bacterium]|nr:DUF4339 domain-containing protein [bacterium]
MAKYFVYKNGVKDGPFDLEALRMVHIYETTLVWRVGDESWRKAFEYEELSDIIEVTPPKIPSDRIGYDVVEDVAEVNYKPAAILTLCYAIANILFSEFMLRDQFGIILNAGLPFLIWWYFKQFFIQLNDRTTAKFVNWVFAGYAAFVPLLVYTLFNGWDERIGRTIGEFLVNVVFGFFIDNYESSREELDSLIFVSKFVFYSFLLTIIFLWIAGIRLLNVNNRYDFPLKRIALSTMFFIPIHMFYLLAHAVVNVLPSWTVMHLLAMVPYLLLASHFYKADSEDATP